MKALPVSNRFLLTCAIAREQAAEERRPIVVRHLPYTDDLAAVPESIFINVMLDRETQGLGYTGRILYRAVPR